MCNQKKTIFEPNVFIQYIYPFILTKGQIEIMRTFCKMVFSYSSLFLGSLETQVRNHFTTVIYMLI